MDSTESSAESAASRKTLIFRAAGEIVGCDIEFVRGVVRAGMTTRVPGAPAYVRGLLNVRGEVLSVLDVGMWMHPDRGPTRGGAIVVVQVGERQAGLIVEEVLGVHEIPPDRAETERREDDPGIVRHLGHLDGRIVLLLDVPAFVNQSLV